MSTDGAGANATICTYSCRGSNTEQERHPKSSLERRVTHSRRSSFGTDSPTRSTKRSRSHICSELESHERLSQTENPQHHQQTAPSKKPKHVWQARRWKLGMTYSRETFLILVANTDFSAQPVRDNTIRALNHLNCCPSHLSKEKTTTVKQARQAIESIGTREKLGRNFCKTDKLNDMNLENRTTENAVVPPSPNCSST